MSTELKPHTHATFIKAWADGHAIQIAGANGTWYDLCDNPSWNLDPSMYRIKPRKIRSTYGYRRYMARNAFDEPIACIHMNTPMGPCVDEIAARETFIAWIDTEWQYHEIEITN